MLDPAVMILYTKSNINFALCKDISVLNNDNNE